MSRSWRCSLVGLALAVVLMLAAPAVRAADTGGPDWVKPAATTAITYGTIYGVVLTAVQSARVLITALAPFEWLAVAQTFGVPMFVVPVMAQLVPAVRHWAPDAADSLQRSLFGSADTYAAQ